MPRELERSAVGRAITALAMRFAGARAQGGLDDACTLELMFVLPDLEVGPVFEGMRLSTYAAGERILVVEAAAPRHLLDSEYAARYVAAVAADAVDAAREFFEEHRIAFDAERRHLMLRSISASDLERELNSRDLPESTWADGETDPRTPA